MRASRSCDQCKSMPRFAERGLICTRWAFFSTYLFVEPSRG